MDAAFNQILQIFRPFSRESIGTSLADFGVTLVQFVARLSCLPRKKSEWRGTGTRGVGGGLLSSPSASREGQVQHSISCERGDLTTQDLGVAYPPKVAARTSSWAWAGAYVPPSLPFRDTPTHARTHTACNAPLRAFFLLLPCFPWPGPRTVRCYLGLTPVHRTGRGFETHQQRTALVRRSRATLFYGSFVYEYSYTSYPAVHPEYLALFTTMILSVI